MNRIEYKNSSLRSPAELSNEYAKKLIPDTYTHSTHFSIMQPFLLLSFKHIHSYFTTYDVSCKESDYDIFNCYSKFLENKIDYRSNRSTFTKFNVLKKANDLRELYFTSEDILLYTFRSLKTKLSAGSDNIPNIILKNLLEEIAIKYVTLLNNTLNNSYFRRA